MSSPASDDDAALDAAIAATGLTLPEPARAAVREGVRRLSVSVARLKVAGFDDTAAERQC